MNRRNAVRSTGLLNVSFKVNAVLTIPHSGWRLRTQQAVSYWLKPTNYILLYRVWSADVCQKMTIGEKRLIVQSNDGAPCLGRLQRTSNVEEEKHHFKRL